MDSKIFHLLPDDPVLIDERIDDLQRISHFDADALSVDFDIVTSFLRVQSRYIDLDANGII